MLTFLFRMKFQPLNINTLVGPFNAVMAAFKCNTRRADKVIYSSFGVSVCVREIRPNISLMNSYRNQFLNANFSAHIITQKHIILFN